MGVEVGGDSEVELGGDGGGLCGGGVRVAMTYSRLRDDCRRFTKLVISELRPHQRPITRHYNS